MMLAGLAAMVLGTMLARGRDIFDFTNQAFGSFVAVTGDAHQAKVAQDIFRQEINYERSLQIREDIRDVNKMMLDSVQTHLFVGSIILGVCFALFIEGHPPEGTHRLIADFWIVFCCWSSTYTLISLWLALCFQAQISHCARERLLRKHRFQMPDDQVVGKMGGGSLVNQMAVFHDRVLELIQRTVRGPAEQESRDHADQFKRKRVRISALKVQVEGKNGRSLDLAPLQKGMHAWLHKYGDTLAAPTILDMPSYLVGETLIRSRWFCNGGSPLTFRVQGEATLYIAAQCPPNTEGSSKDGISKALRLNGIVPEWPADQLPFVTEGYHDAWRGPSGNGEFRRVNGFSIFVDKAHIEMPIYKIVLASPFDKGDGMVDIQVDWRFQSGCEGLLLILRTGQVHCKEEDWPIVEFNEEIKQVMPLRDYSGLYLRHGVSCLIFAAFLTCLARLWVGDEGPLWGFEVMLLIVALTPALLTILFIPIHQTGARITQTIQAANASLSQGGTSKMLTRAKPLGTRRLQSDSDELEGPEEADEDTVDGYPEKVYGDVTFCPDGVQGETNGFNNGLSIVAADQSIAPGLPPADAAVEFGGQPTASTSKWRTSPRYGREWLASPDTLPAAWVRSPPRDLSSSPRGRRRSPQQDAGLSPRAERRSPRQASPPKVMFPLLSEEGACGRALGKLGEGFSRLPDCKAMELGSCREVVRPPRRNKPAIRTGSSPQRSPPRPAAVAQVHDHGFADDARESNMSSYRSHERSLASDESIAVPTDAVPSNGHAHDQVGFRGSSLEWASPMTQDEHVVQQEPTSRETLRDFIQKVPEVIRPLDPDNPFMIEGAAAKSLRRTMRKFKVWTHFLWICFGLSLLSAASSPYLWAEWLQEAFSLTPSPAPAPASPSPAGATLIAAALTQLPWLELEVAWPPFFHPTAAAFGSVAVGAEQREVLWLAADGVLRAFAASAGSSALSPGSSLLLPLAARGLGLVAGGLAAVGPGALVEVNLSSLPQAVWAASPVGLLDAVALTAVRPPRSLPSGVADDAADVLAAAVLPGLDVVAVASAHDPAAPPASSVAGASSGIRTTVHLCGAGAGAGASAAGPLRTLGRLGPLEGAVRALYACGNGTCAGEAVLWAAVNGGLAAVGLNSGTVLASFAAPRVAARGAHALLRGTASNASGGLGVVAALTGNATHLLAVVAADGRRPAVFSTPLPTLPAQGGPLVEL